MTALLREDAANQREALGWMAQGDYRRARGNAELLINDDHRARLIATIGATLPAEHAAYERYWVEWEAQRRAQHSRKGKSNAR